MHAPRYLRRLLASIAIGAAGYMLVETVFVDNGLLAALFAVLLAGLAYLVQVQAYTEAVLGEMRVRVDRGFEITAARVDAGFAKANEVTQLFSLMEASTLRTDAMTQLLRSVTSIDSSAPAVVFKLVEVEITRLTEFIRALSDRGQAVYDGEERDWLLGLCRVATTTVDGISFATVDAAGRLRLDNEIWTSDFGLRYLDAQRDAVRRGVSIRRIFAADRPELLADDEFLRIFEQHLSIGVSVRMISAVDLQRLRTPIFDFSIFDGAVSYEATPASRIGDVSMVATRLVLEPSRVTARASHFEEFWGAAQAVPTA